MNKNRIIGFISILAIALLNLACSQKETKPNIIIILSDDQGWGDLSINGNTNLSTPNIDKLAYDGAIFENFYVAPVCSPTRAEMLTGRYHSRGGVYSTSAGGERLDLDETTLADVFKEAGYATAAYGKWHNGMQYPYHPNARGFDDFYGFCSGHWGNYFDPVLEHNQEIVKGEGYLVDDLTNHGIDFIEKHKDEPFLLYLPLNTPHSPMQVPDTYWDKFEDQELKMLADSDKNEDPLFTKAALAMCENIDWNVGRILKKLKELNLEEETIVLYFSDNGPNSWRWNGNMKGRKGSTDEGGVRSPLIIRWPGKIKKDKNVSNISGAIDLLPTLAELAGLKPNILKDLDGISLKPLLLEENPIWENRNLFNHWRNRTSVRSQKYRLDSQGALYDIEQDRSQTIDLSLDFPEIKSNLLEAKEHFENEVLSELPKEDTRSFPLGHPDALLTQIPARDGVAHGNIERSNQFPNCSFFTNWTSTEDSITWEVEVIEEGDFELVLYYTCPESDEGSEFEISFKNDRLISKIETPFDSELLGMENDRVPRGESYIKEFKAMNLGEMHLEKGKAELSLKAVNLSGKTVMDFRMLTFERIR